MRDENSLTASIYRDKSRFRCVARRKLSADVTVKGAHENNLRDLTVAIPLGVFTCITAFRVPANRAGARHDVSRALAEAESQRERGVRTKRSRASSISTGHSRRSKPIGRTPRSNPATYTGLFTISASCCATA